MTTPVTDDELRNLRRVHHRVERPARDGHMCAACKGRWPCVIKRLLYTLGAEK